MGGKHGIASPHIFGDNHGNQPQREMSPTKAETATANPARSLIHCKICKMFGEMIQQLFRISIVEKKYESKVIHPEQVFQFPHEEWQVYKTLQ